MATKTAKAKARPLRDLYIAAGYNRSSFARAVGVQRNTTWRWETGEHGLNMAMCKKVADVLGVSMETVLQAVGHREAS